MITTNQNASQIRKSPSEFAANYRKITQDGLYTGVTVGNINVVITEEGKTRSLGAYERGAAYPKGARIIFNLACKTTRSKDKMNNEVGASYSCPADWANIPNLETGDIAEVQIVDGYVKKIKAAKAVLLSSLSVNPEGDVVAATGTPVADDMSETSADKALTDAEAPKVQPKSEGSVL